MSQTWWMRLLTWVSFDSMGTVELIVELETAGIRVPVSEFQRMNTANKIVEGNGASECLSVCGWRGPVFCALLMVQHLLFFIQSIISTTIPKRKLRCLNAEGLQESYKRNKKQFSDPQHRFCPLFRLQWMVVFWCGASSGFALKIWPQLLNLLFRRIVVRLLLNQYFGRNRFCQNSRTICLCSFSAMVHQEGLWFLCLSTSPLIAISWIALLPITNRMLHPSMLQSVCYNAFKCRLSKCCNKHFSRKENFQIWSVFLNQLVSP